MGSDAARAGGTTGSTLESWSSLQLMPRLDKYSAVRSCRSCGRADVDSTIKYLNVEKSLPGSQVLVPVLLTKFNLGISYPCASLTLYPTQRYGVVGTDPNAGARQINVNERPFGPSSTALRNFTLLIPARCSAGTATSPVGSSAVCSLRQERDPPSPRREGDLHLSGGIG